MSRRRDDDSHPRTAGTPQWSRGLQGTSSRAVSLERKFKWSLLAPGFELGGRSGKFTVSSMVGNKLG